MRVMGIDCGGEITGYGVVEQQEGHKLRHVCSGAIRMSVREPLAERLTKVFRELGQVIAEHQPEVVAIEDVFYSANVKSALKLGQVRGVAMLAASWHGLHVAEYAPLAIKSAVTGYGKAEKHQVASMVALLLELAEAPQPSDVADALAIAICHLHTASTIDRQRAPAGTR